MKLSDANYDNHETGCCARLDRQLWDERELSFTNQHFVKDHIHAFLHVPLNFGSVMGREHAAVAKAEAYPEHPFWLVDEVSPWGSDVYFAVDRDVPGADVVSMTGTFLTKVFEGPYGDMGRWISTMHEHVTSRGKALDKLYFFYATCPKCAKHFGKNEVVVFAKVH